MAIFLYPFFTCMQAGIADEDVNKCAEYSGLDGTHIFLDFIGTADLRNCLTMSPLNLLGKLKNASPSSLNAQVKEPFCFQSAYHCLYKVECSRLLRSTFPAE